MSSTSLSEISPIKEKIRLYAKQLRTPTFSDYEQVIRQLATGEGCDSFLCALLKTEIFKRQETSQKRRIKKARFPFMKTLDEFDCKRLEHVSEAFLW